jgi:hypothetical protein
MPVPFSPNVKLRPSHYTTSEGGNWIAWPDYHPGFPKGDEFLESCLTFLNRDAKRLGWIQIDGIRLHSLKFADGRSWDMLNGWRSDVPFANKT